MHRAEGFAHETVTAEAKSYDEANDLLKAWAKTAPSRGKGYHKVDIVVRWSDGIDFGGTYTLKRDDVRKSKPIENWIRNRCATIAGLWKPAHMSAEAYRQYRLQFSPKEQVLAGMILDEYEM
jgi:hypothetical protein